MESFKNKCATCKFFSQGEGSSYCSHELATEQERKYRYYNFDCDDQSRNKWEGGTHQSRTDYMNSLK